MFLVGVSNLTSVDYVGHTLSPLGTVRTYYTLFQFLAEVG